MGVNPTTYFLWQGGNVIAELTLAGNPTAVYTYGINLITSTAGSTTRYYLYNAHGDVAGLADTSGTVVKYYRYDAFGNEINADPNDTNPFRYSGQYFDKETGDYYLQARYYDPSDGRFTQQDGWEYANGSDPLNLNLYTYCVNDPVNLYDPSGHYMEVGPGGGCTEGGLSDDIYAVSGSVGRVGGSFGEGGSGAPDEFTGGKSTNNVEETPTNSKSSGIKGTQGGVQASEDTSISIRNAKLKGTVTNNESKSFEQKISKMNPNERVAAVKTEAAKIAYKEGLVKDSKLTKINGRDVYRDPRTGKLYAVDTQHGRFEMVDGKSGKHLGEVDFDFNLQKPADKSGGHNLKLK